VKSENLDAYHFSELLQRGIANEVRQMTGQKPAPILSAKELSDMGRAFAQRMQFGDAFLSAYKGLVFQVRAEGISLSDRRVVKMLKLFAASAFLDGREAPDASDFFLMKHIWNSEDQADILEGIVQPVLETFFREHPDRRRVGSIGIGVEALTGEIDRIRQVLTGSGALGDVQLFSQLKALGEIKAALATLSDPRARELEARVQQLLEASFRSGRFAQL
jgi:MoxR-like ATPase